MADSTPLPSVDQLAGKVMDALADILRSSVSPEALQAQNLLLKRMALEGDVFPSRIPAPRNITEVGGYLNLLNTLNETEMRTQALAATLGVAGPNPIPGFTPTGLVLYDALRANDRPAGAAQAATPVQFRVRNDFALALDAALKQIHETGCTLPLYSPLLPLPPVIQGGASPADVLPFLGRSLELMPTAALIDPDTDPLALARLDGSTTLLVVARQIDASAPNAAAITAQNWAAWQCTATACAEVTANRKYLPLGPILNAAGWYQGTPSIPVKLASPGNWGSWANTTGLIPGRTRLGDELQQRYTREEIAASQLREYQAWLWDGQKFVSP
jgi:hypothetical protein